MQYGPYADLLEKARADLARAMAESHKIEMQVARLQRTVLALSSLVDQPSIDPAMGITEGIKAALREASPNGFYPTTLRIRLEDVGFDFSQSSNPLASIHTILKRLVKQRLVEVREQSDGKQGYFWSRNRDGDNPHEFLKTFGVVPPTEAEINAVMERDLKELVGFVPPMKAEKRNRTRKDGTK